MLRPLGKYLRHGDVPTHNLTHHPATSRADTPLCLLCVCCHCVCPSPAAPKMCPAGTFGPTLGATSQDACVNCPIGTYQDMDGSYECKVCDENTFASAPGATQCTACGDGYQVSGEGSNFCNPCSAGTYRLAAESETCKPCRPGTSSGQGRCGIGEQVWSWVGDGRQGVKGPCGRGLGGAQPITYIHQQLCVMMHQLCSRFGLHQLLCALHTCMLWDKGWSCHWVEAHRMLQGIPVDVAAGTPWLQLVAQVTLHDTTLHAPANLPS
jgi:hypothetical protein